MKAFALVFVLFASTAFANEPQPLYPPEPHANDGLKIVNIERRLDEIEKQLGAIQRQLITVQHELRYPREVRERSVPPRWDGPVWRPAMCGGGGCCGGGCCR